MVCKLYLNKAVKNSSELNEMGKGTFETGESKRDTLMKSFMYIIRYAYRGPHIRFYSQVKTHSS